jgi:ribosomal protein L11 methyltransferase
MRMARDLARAAAPGGFVILSGLLRRQEAGVLAAYRAQHLRLDSRVVIDGWSTLILCK